MKLWHIVILVLENHPKLLPVMWQFVSRKNISTYDNINLLSCRHEMQHFYTCKTTLLDMVKTAPIRYRHPIALSLSNEKSCRGSKLCPPGEEALCRRLSETAPITHNKVPTILTLLYIQLMFTFSNLHDFANHYIC